MNDPNPDLPEVASLAEKLPGCAPVLGLLGIVSGVGMVGYLVWLDFPLVVAFLRDYLEVLAATALVCLLGLAALIVGSALRGRG